MFEIYFDFFNKWVRNGNCKRLKPTLKFHFELTKMKAAIFQKQRNRHQFSISWLQSEKSSTYYSILPRFLKTNLIVLCLHFNFCISPIQSFNAHFPFARSLSPSLSLWHTKNYRSSIHVWKVSIGNTNTSYRRTHARTHPLFQHFPLDCSSMCLCCS